MQNIRLAVDAIVFGYEASTLYVLLVKQKFGLLQGQWVLPGGFVLDDEPLQAAVLRELREETGVEVDYLEQLYTFGDNIGRDPRGRVVSVAYFALVNPRKLHLMTQTDTDAEEACWFSVDKLPPLGFDHADMVTVAVERLRGKIEYQPIGFDLLGETFPFSDLENLYTTLLRRDIDRRNFRKKILSFGILEETGEQDPKSGGRPAKLFRFNKLIYNDLFKRGFHFEIKFA